MEGFITKSLIAPRPKPLPKLTDAKRLKEAEETMNKLSSKMSNLGIPLLPLHKLDPVAQNRLSYRLANPDVASKDWRQIDVMVPIFKQNAAPH